MRDLHQIFIDHQYAPDYGDKGSVHTYTKEYEILLAPYRDNHTILEIGLEYGGSLKMWNEYFTNSKIVGLSLAYPDYVKRYPDDIKGKINGNEVTIIEGNACYPEILEQVKDFTFDVIIDDGSHLLKEQVSSFELFKTKMNKGGIYIIEDIQNLEEEKEVFESLHDNLTIIDNRHINNRWDDILLVYKF